MARNSIPEPTVEALPSHATTIAYLDPNTEPVKVVDQVTFHPVKNSLISLTLCSLTPTTMSDGTTTYPPMVAARLRLSPEMARMFAHGLHQQLAMLERGDKPSN